MKITEDGMLEISLVMAPNAFYSRRMMCVFCGAYLCELHLFWYVTARPTIHVKLSVSAHRPYGFKRAQVELKLGHITN